VVVGRRGPVVVITINRPQVRNAINLSVAEAIRDAADELDACDDLRVGVLTGAGGVFSAGMDLKCFARGERPVFPGRGLAGISETPTAKPLIAAVEGWALGAGFELTLACDIVVAARSARFAVPEVKRGLVAGRGGALLVPQRVPYAVAMDLLLTGDPVDAPRAAEIGLVSRLVEDGQALATALQIADTIAANAPLAVQATKQVARLAEHWTGPDAWDRCLEITEPVALSEDAREGARAFAERRLPAWQSR
jgi:enoyl-CoA hydratase